MTTRRLAAIIAADVAGYWRLMHADEEGTHAAFTAIMTGGVEPAVVKHGGRLVKSTGDGFVAEFPSAIEAVRCALQFQETIARRNAPEAPEQQLRLRVGINLGDVIGTEAPPGGDRAGAAQADRRPAGLRSRWRAPAGEWLLRCPRG